jgi:hypothetical protein
MSFEKNFCSSPWFHMRINNSGSYEFCRWKSKSDFNRVDLVHNIRQQTPTEYFQQTLAPVRQALLDGQALDDCTDCYLKEQHGKVSGRQKQLLKAGIRIEYFDKTLISSPLKPAFDYSQDNAGNTLEHVRDWQIDLGNYCNGACVFCNPGSSSRLATEFRQLGLISELPPPAWCDDPEQLQVFCDTLRASPNIQYLHFIGGETLITPGFQTILKILVDEGLADHITIGFTTNLTVWSDPVVDLLKQFQQVHLGLSVEALTKINDYVRYPSQLDRTQELLNRWVELGQQQDWLIQIRVTPTCLTVHDLDTVYDYAWHNELTIESCNFLDEPACLRISVLTPKYRKLAQEKLTRWLAQHQVEATEQIVNIRNPNTVRQQICQDAESYLNYLESAEDESHRWPDLITYLKRLESGRNNCILDYLPREYEELFRSQGY